ncbi:MAG: thioredoxin domain-containing protein [Verrucomicrobiota bacterium]
MTPRFPLLLCFALLAVACRAAEAGAPGNRLARETSPYLRQHATNPVDWYPWGPEAFARARAENKLIFLSVGYSTCHWCHVMERESFADPAVAAALNAAFVCIKVDREERPDVDRLYMTCLQAATGGGGWPMTLWLTPDLKPVFGGTYFPPESAPGRPGLKLLAARLAQAWQEDRAAVLAQAEGIFAALVEETRTLPAGSLPAIAPLRDRGLAAAEAAFDARHGGFEDAPKFPNAAVLEFLLDAAAVARDPATRERALRPALHTLRALVAGGIHDQLGGGFHRYAVDAGWRVPHFEKMLADQAQLAGALLTAWQLSGDSALRDAAQDTLAYVQNRLTAPGGAFLTAEDADSAAAHTDAAHAEGAFYVWTAAELESALGRTAAALPAHAFGIEPGGNTGPAGGESLAGKNVLYRARSIAECAAHFGLSEEETGARLAAAAARLREARDRRPRPALDDKIVTSWNGLMISAFARAAQALREPAHAVAAARAAAFLHRQLRDPATGRLAHSHRAGVSDSRAFPEDYAFLIQGLLDLHEADADVRWLDWAVELQRHQDALFRDEAGGYFHSVAGDPGVPLRLKAGDDGAEPSANAISIRNLARLAAILHDATWRQAAEHAARAFAPQLEHAPFSAPVMLAALGWLASPAQQIIIQGEPADPRTGRLLAEVWSRHLPRRVLLHVNGANRPWLERHIGFIRALPSASDPTAYVCENFVCRLPTGDPAELARQLTGGEK